MAPGKIGLRFLAKSKLRSHSGLGAIICEKFAAEGANIIVNYASSEDRAQEVAKKAEAHGVKAFCIKAVG